MTPLNLLLVVVASESVWPCWLAESCLILLLAGPAVSLVPLIIASQGSSVTTAVLCLTGTLSLQAFCYAGFHAYVQVTATTYSPSCSALSALAPQAVHSSALSALAPLAVRN